MKWFSFLLAATAAMGAGAQESLESQVLPVAVQARRDGCKGHAGTKTPLRWSAPLARAGALIAKGGVPLQAIEVEGYRPTRIFHASLVGHRNVAEAARAFAQHYCADVVDPKFIDIGAHREGNRLVVVLAAPFQLPRLSDARGAAQRVLALVNQARAQPRRCGGKQFAAAPPLAWNAKLEEAAARHAADMASFQYLEHKGRDGSTPSQRIAATGYRWRSVGENIAAGQPTPEEVVDDWLASPGHCANIMEPAFAEMGAAFSVNMNAAAAVYWAQEFGRPR